MISMLTHSCGHDSQLNHHGYSDESTWRTSGLTKNEFIERRIQQLNASPCPRCIRTKESNA